MDDILKRIKKEIDTRDWGVNRLAKESGISAGTISKVLSGERSISLHVLRGISEAFGWSFFIQPIEMLIADPGQAALDLKRLISAFNKLSSQDRAIVIALVLKMLQSREGPPIEKGAAPATGRRLRRSRT